MRRRFRKGLFETRALRLVVLALLIVSAAQVFWWILDQSRRTEALRQRLIALYTDDVRAAEALRELGAAEPFLEELFPHLEVTPGGAIAIREAVIESLREDRVRWLNQYGWEGAFFLVVLVVAMAAVWRALHQESELRRRQQNFIASVSHELKSPLASLKLSVETLGLRELPRERVVGLAERMEADLERMEDMISKILDASRLDERRVPLRPQNLLLEAAVARALDELENRIAATGAVVESAVDPGIVIRADPVGVRTVLRNLLDNAVEAVSAKGGGKIRVRAERDERFVRVLVEDDGVGFPPGDAERLFEKFYRPGDEMRRRGHGQGLGLFIVRRFVELEGGRVAASSAGTGRGATFEVEWPAAAGAES